MKINLTAKTTTITHDKESVTHTLESRGDWRAASTMIKMRLGFGAASGLTKEAE